MSDGSPDIRIGTLVDGRGQDPAGYIAQLVPLGFESVGLTFWQWLGDVDLDRLADAVRAALDGSDVRVTALSIFGNPLEDQPLDVAGLRAWERLIDAAPRFGADLVTGFTGRLRGRSVAESIPRFQAVFTPLAERALARGVRLGFENCAMEGDWRSGDWNIAHGPAAWELMFEAMPAPNVGLEWEPCHQLLSLIDPLPQLRRWVGKIVHVHGKCANVYWDVVREQGVRGPRPYAVDRTPGFGDCDWAQIIGELRRGGFTGAIDIEGFHDPVYRDALEMTGQVYALNYLKRCRGVYVPNPS
jgi:sugar phosphate isomerase/epimerase